MPFAGRSMCWCLIGLGLLGGCGLFNPVTDPNHGANVGSACASPGSQSTCDPTQTCAAISSKNMCTLTCQSDSDCGKNGTLTNHCLSYQGSNICVRACDPTVGNSCGRTDFQCLTSSGVSYCIPDCRQQAATFCTYGTLCDETTGTTADANAGQCQPQGCSSNSACPSGTICAPVDQQMFCVADCRTSSSVCPSGTQCNMSGGCDTVMLQPFQTCTGTGAMCAAGSECVQGTSSAVCLVTCTRDDNCAMLASQTTGTPVCRLQLQSGLSACIVQCDPNLTMCPGNTTCQQDSQLGAYFCLP